MNSPIASRPLEDLENAEVGKELLYQAGADSHRVQARVRVAQRIGMLGCHVDVLKVSFRGEGVADWTGRRIYANT